ncbi:MAG: glutamate-cysteine ligase family protein [Candidatus Omnitrophota bacterium]
MPEGSRRRKKRPHISVGVELETYSIAMPENRICRELHFPKRSAVEKGERFIRDWSIGSEYNSKVFTRIREAFFLLKTGLRKYSMFKQDDGGKRKHIIFPIGGWSDRFAGTHIHISLGRNGISYEDASALAGYLHGHIPFIIAIAANSPVWRRQITGFASNRLLKGSDKYCKITKNGILPKARFREITYNKPHAKKPPTLELRVCDSALPEYIVAALCVVNAVALRWLRKKPPLNQSTAPNYLKARDQAIRYGVDAKLVWSDHWITVPQYTDLFFRKYKDELEAIDIPDEIVRIFKYLKRGVNQATVIRDTVTRCKRVSGKMWQKQFAKRYVSAIERLLDGDSFEKFTRDLGVKLPYIERSWLGYDWARW